MIIYKATNIENGKFYIGKSIGNLKGVMNRHLRGSKNPNSIFHHAIKKHGWDVFIWEIIDNNTVKTEDELYLLEKKYVDQLNSISPNGYNSTVGGRGGYSAVPWNKGIKIPEEKKINMYGHKPSEEVKTQIGLTQKGKPKKPCTDSRRSKISLILKGRTHTEQSKKNMGAPKKGRKLSEEHKKNISLGMKRKAEIKRALP